jgi:two-component system, NarL family, response regulator DevR
MEGDGQILPGPRVASIEPPIPVVVVEPNQQLRHLLPSLLAESGVNVLDAVGTLCEGRDAVLDWQPDVAVVDLRLPDGTGIELSRQLNLLAPAVAFILHPWSLTAADEEEARSAGLHTIVLKEIRPTSLVAAILELAGRRPHPSLTSGPMSR